VRKQSCDCAAVSLTADLWTSTQNRSYLGVTAHFIEGWTLQSVVLSVMEVAESHTAAVCGQRLVEVVDE